MGVPVTLVTGEIRTDSLGIITYMGDILPISLTVLNDGGLISYGPDEVGSFRRAHFWMEEPIQELVESDESDVILYWLLDSDRILAGA
jgi:hypothetical protein